MRELTVRMRFTTHCLGNLRDRASSNGRLIFVRTANDKVMFLPSWHHQNMRFAARLLGRHHGDVNKIVWDVEVDSARTFKWYRRYYNGRDNRRRYAEHEAFIPGDIVGVNCAVPSSISEDDLINLMNLAGKYNGLSPWRGEYGLYNVVSVTRRRGLTEAESNQQEEGNVKPQTA